MQRLSLRERLTRIGGGLLLTAAGAVVFAVSKARDPENRWAIAGILAILGGLSWAGQGLRGRRDGPILHESHEEEAAGGEPISAERTVAGIVAAWLVPGLGHWLIGRRAKAILFFVTITATFLAGMLLAQGRNLSYERDGVYFLAYMFNGGETLLGWLLTRNLELTHRIPYLQLGFLYTAVACLLNLVVMMDFVSTCSRSVERDPGGGGSSPEEATRP